MSDCYIYVYRDCAGCVLYIGISKNRGYRLAAHERKPWGRDIASVEFIGPMFRDAALREEARLIGDLLPKHNITHNPNRPAPSPVCDIAPRFFRCAMALVGWDTRKLAEEAGVNRITVSRFLNGGTTKPAPKFLAALSRHGVSIEETAEEYIVTLSNQQA